MKGELGAYDRQVIDKHLTSLRAFETRRAQLLGMRSNPGAACGLPATASKVPTDEASVRTGADTQFLAPFFMQSIATAFNCGMTRVASVTFGYPGGGGAGGLRMPWLGFTDAQHSVSHHGNGAEKLRKYGLMNAWTHSQVKLLLDELAAVPTPGGTLLDETTVYLFNRHGDGNGHTNFALPNVILGGTGGVFKTGQVLALPKTSPTKVLISIAHAMGVAVTSFGSGAFVDTSPMAGITALIRPRWTPTSAASVRSLTSSLTKICFSRALTVSSPIDSVLGNLTIGLAPGHQAQHRHLAGGQRLVVHLVHQPRGQRRVDQPAPGVHHPDRVQHALGEGVLQQVAAGAGLHGPVDVLVGVVAGHHDDVGLRGKLADLGDDVGAAQAGHAQIQQGDVGLVLGKGGDGAASVRRLGHHLHVRFRVDDGAQPHPHHLVIVGHQHSDLGRLSHGHSCRSRSGP